MQSPTQAQTHVRTFPVDTHTHTHTHTSYPLNNISFPSLITPPLKKNKKSGIYQLSPQLTVESGCNGVSFALILTLTMSENSLSHSPAHTILNV